MGNLEHLKDMLCKELDEIIGKGEVSLGDLDVVTKLTDSIKNIDKIIMADKYNYRGSYDNGERSSYNGFTSSYAPSRHYVRGHYSYGDDLSERLEEMLDNGRIDGNDKRILKQAMEVLRK